MMFSPQPVQSFWVISGATPLAAAVRTMTLARGVAKGATALSDEVLEAVRVVLRRLEGTRNRARRPPGDKILPAANPHNHSANLALRLAARLASISEKPL